MFPSSDCVGRVAQIEALLQQGPVLNLAIGRCLSFSLLLAILEIISALRRADPTSWLELSQPRPLWQGCPACPKRILTIAKFADHLADAVFQADLYAINAVTLKNIVS